MKKLSSFFFLLIFYQITVCSQSCLPEGINFTTQEQIDNFQYNYPDCIEIEGNVWIAYDQITNLNGLSLLSSIGGFLWITSTTLQNLAGLNNLISVGGNLRIVGNYDLTNLSGLDNLTSINGKLEIWDNYELINISALEKLTAINGNLEIHWNIGLNSLTGIDNINAGSIDNLSINYNYSLSSCEVQSICDYLISPNGVIDIFRNAPGCDNPPEIAEAGGVSIPCLPYGNYHFRNQSVIDSFQSDFPYCSNLAGDIFIAGDNITNVDGLYSITSIEGDLIIWDCNYLTSISGLNSLSFIGGNLYISVNFILPSLTGLEALTTIGGYLKISNNPELISLMGLNNLISGVGTLGIWYNDILTSLTGIDNIEPGAITSLDIVGNDSLTTCEVKSICDILAIPGFSINIHDNATGCNSQQEVDDACEAVTVNENIFKPEFLIKPNPANSSIIITYREGIKIKKVNIYNQIGQIVLNKKGLTNTIDVSSLQPGIYIVELVTSELRIREKLIIR